MERESNIVAEQGRYWILKSRTQYTVYKCGLCVSTADSSYPLTDDGLSIAIARMNYLANRMEDSNASL